MTSDSARPRDPIPSDLVQDDQSFADLVQEFVDGLGTRLADMETAFDEGDLGELKVQAHRLKGAGGGHGYAILTELSAHLEQLTLAADLDGIRRDIEELKSVISRIVVSVD